LAVIFSCLLRGQDSLSTCSSSAAEPSPEERFLKEAPEKWAEYRQIVSRHVEGRSNAASHVDFVGKTKHGNWDPTWETAFVLNVVGERSRAKSILFENGQPKQVETFNPDYHVELTMGRGGWTIDWLRMGATAIPDDLIRAQASRPLLTYEDSTFGSAMRRACLGQCLGAAWLPRLVASADFHVTHVSAVGHEGLVKVEFSFEPSGNIEKTVFVRSGFMILDSKRYWLLREADTAAHFVWATNEGRGTLSIKHEFSNANMPIPYVSRHVYTATSEKGYDEKPWKHVATETVAMRDVPDIDPKQFTLSAYGLPEPAKK
jgi:hypothetical protein